MTITRGEREIAELRPAPRYTLGALVAALRELPPVDEGMLRDIEGIRAAQLPFDPTSMEQTWDET